MSVTTVLFNLGFPSGKQLDKLYVFTGSSGIVEMLTPSVSFSFNTVGSDLEL